MKWLLIGLVLVALWYVLAPLFTPSSLRPSRPGPGRQHPPARQKTGKRQQFTVIDGRGRVVDEEAE